MRSLRGSKFAEYMATYAIKMRLGIHETTLVECRDASVGYGVFVKDACDAGTPLLVIPSKRACAMSTMEMIGAPLRLCPPDLHKLSSMNEGVVSSLLGCNTEQWAYLAWRLAIEYHRSYSPWWGWLSVLPDLNAFKSMNEDCERQCRLHHTTLLPYFKYAFEGILQEATAVHTLLAEENVIPSFDIFLWAVHVVLSRAQHLPLCWSSVNCEVSTSELGILPLIDLINGDDGLSRRRNATVEVAFTVEELPEWYRAWFFHEAQLRGVNAEDSLRYILEEHYFAVVVLERPVTASEEVILEYELLPWAPDEALAPNEQLRLSRFLRYRF